MSLYIYTEDTRLLWPNLIKKNQCWCFSLPRFTASYSAVWVIFLSKSHDDHLYLTSCSGSLCWALGIFPNIWLFPPQHVTWLYTSTHKVRCGCGTGVGYGNMSESGMPLRGDGCRASVGLAILSGETAWQCLRRWLLHPPGLLSDCDEQSSS